MKIPAINKPHQEETNEQKSIKKKQSSIWNILERFSGDNPQPTSIRSEDLRIFSQRLRRRRPGPGRRRDPVPVAPARSLRRFIAGEDGASMSKSVYCTIIIICGLTKFIKILIFGGCTFGCCKVPCLHVRWTGGSPGGDLLDHGLAACRDVMMEDHQRLVQSKHVCGLKLCDR